MIVIDIYIRIRMTQIHIMMRNGRIVALPNLSCSRHPSRKVVSVRLLLVTHVLRYNAEQRSHLYST